MRYVYTADRLKDMLSYYKDTLEDIRKSLAVDKGDIDCEEIFNTVKDMVKKLEDQARYEYEYALENTSVPFWKKADDVVPKPSICIDSIIKYVEENGLEISGTFPYAVSQYEESIFIDSSFKITSSGNKHTIFPIDSEFESRSFIVYHPESNTQQLQRVNQLIQQIHRYFENVLTGTIAPEKYDLNPDEQHVLELTAKYIREHNDKQQ